MGTLNQDLSRYKQELYYKHDLKAGFKLLGELSGLASLTIGGFALTSTAVPFLNSVGIPITMALAHRFLFYAGKAYSELDTGERKTIRAVSSFIKGGFSFSRFID
jgi:hypothetical protein